MQIQQTQELTFSNLSIDAIKVLDAKTKDIFLNFLQENASKFMAIAINKEIRGDKSGYMFFMGKAHSLYDVYYKIKDEELAA